MKLQQLLAPFRKAINEYGMIEDGDKIAVGVSGGKDSMVLLALFNAFSRFADKKFEFMGITIDNGLTPDAFSPIEKYCAENGIRYVVEKTDIAEIVFNVRKEENPCSLCSKMRRGALNSTLLRYGCNKLALGHHRDDVVQTFLLSLIHENRLSTFQPVSFMSRAKVGLIRPMIYIPEKDIASYAKANLPVVESSCPANKNTERESMKTLLSSLQKQYPDVVESIAGAIAHPERYNLWDGVIAKYLEQKNDSDDD